MPCRRDQRNSTAAWRGRNFRERVYVCYAHIMDVLDTLVPKLAYRHDSPAHVGAHFLSGLVGPSVHVPVRDGKLGLGEFQRIVLLEFEGPRRREIEVRLLREA